MKKLAVLVGAISILAGCQSTTEPQSTPLEKNDAVPSWVLSPVQEDGLASSSCVAWGGNMAAARAAAIANAKADLALQIETRAKVMDKTINQQQQQNLDVSSSSSFTQVSKQVAQQSLIGAIPQAVAFARIDNQKQLCAFVVLKNSKMIFDKLIAEAKLPLNPQSETMLFKQFQEQKTVEELEAQLK
ncbi:hypothetical protein HR45_01220 [Shewanella mangrovi]|uniref:LPP20 lipoprotein n=1 Tax=Shewanella mangrovi TaxID=1515746 RepID=A0A094JIK1_9GAMM|nr:hypothetical protein [Shewanella mangrovi]KFZ39047.1 hypothetical protein HR45_01220 [Shewanella mangrovi]